MTTIIQQQRQTSQEKGAPLTSVKVSTHNVAASFFVFVVLYTIAR